MWGSDNVALAESGSELLRQKARLYKPSPAAVAQSVSLSGCKTLFDYPNEGCTWSTHMPWVNLTI